MPFVVVNAEGLYLKRHANRTYMKREWVAELDQATVWDKSGPAKLCANLARLKNGSASIQLQEVKLMLWGNPVIFTARKPK